MIKIIIDFESYCNLDITLVGANKYADHPSCRVLCMSYKIDDAPTQIWIAGANWPEDLREAINNPASKIYAFGATFEILIWRGPAKRDYPEYFVDLPISKFIDVRALCSRFRMPQNLSAAGKALECNTEKMAIGKRLIRVCCKPGHNPTQRDYADLYAYCIVDTDVLSEILDALPADHFTPLEQSLWELTFRINERGVPIDLQATKSIIKYINAYMTEMTTLLPEITNGLIQTPGQIQKIKQFCKLHGIDTPNLQADTVKKLLNQNDLPEDVRTVLEIRQLTGLSSLKKYTAIVNMENNGYVQGNLNYHRAGTGRWGGQGFQFHNLPRAKVDDPEKYIQKFINVEEIDKPAQIAKALIRPMICAPEGYSLIVSDYTSVENMFLAFCCDDLQTLNLFRNKECQYTDMASFLYNKPIEDITKDERFFGKTIILGCGFQMGAIRFRDVAADQGIILNMAESESVIKAYRTKYRLVVKMWKAYNIAAIRAVQYPRKSFSTHKTIFKMVTANNGRQWLRVTLPSHRGLMYADPKVEEGRFGPVVAYTGFSSTTFQMKRIALTPGLITENIIQGSTRDILANGKLNIEKHMDEVVLNMSVHDEAGGLIKNSDIKDDTLDRFNYQMCKRLPWFLDLPLRAEGYIAKRYRKD